MLASAPFISAWMMSRFFQYRQNSSGQTSRASRAHRWPRRNRHRTSRDNNPLRVLRSPSANARYDHLVGGGGSGGPKHPWDRKVGSAVTTSRRPLFELRCPVPHRHRSRQTHQRLLRLGLGAARVTTFGSSMPSAAVASGPTGGPSCLAGWRSFPWSACQVTDRRHGRIRSTADHKKGRSVTKVKRNRHSRLFSVFMLANCEDAYKSSQEPHHLQGRVDHSKLVTLPVYTGPGRLRTRKSNEDFPLFRFFVAARGRARWDRIAGYRRHWRARNRPSGRGPRKWCFLTNAVIKEPASFHRYRWQGYQVFNRINARKCGAKSYSGS